MLVSHHSSLKQHTSLSLQASANTLIIVQQTSDFAELHSYLKNKKHGILILGEGSNVVFRSNFPGIVILIKTQGKTIREDSNSINLQIESGENWNELVKWSLEHDYFGLENLSLIPGSVGAAPVQNIGAYGVELNSVCDGVETFDLKTGKFVYWSKQDCHFAYRSSIFKSTAFQHHIITRVDLRLSRQAHPINRYNGIKNYLSSIGKDAENPKHIAEAVIYLRQQKLPNPKTLPNVGSFFKNPVVSEEWYRQAQTRWPDMPAFPFQSKMKLSAAWLIEQCGWKSKQYHGAGVSEKHALVIVNHGTATGETIWQLAVEIQLSVHEKFSVDLAVEPLII